MTDELTPGIRKQATEWAKQITKLANKNLGKFTNLILVKSHTEVKEGKVNIIIEAFNKQTDEYGRVKNVTRAYEYGSGIHSRRAKKSPKQLGAKGKILIKPTSGKFLAFNWQVANASPESFTFLDDGRVLLPAVKHPGVKAVNNNKGYLAPAITEINKKIRRELPDKEVRPAIIRTLNKALKK